MARIQGEHQVAQNSNTTTLPRNTLHCPSNESGAWIHLVIWRAGGSSPAATMENKVSPAMQKVRATLIRIRPQFFGSRLGTSLAGPGGRISANHSPLHNILRSLSTTCQSPAPRPHHPTAISETE